jgi:hypothetical protein
LRCIGGASHPEYTSNFETFFDLGTITTSETKKATYFDKTARIGKMEG